MDSLLASFSTLIDKAPIVAVTSGMVSQYDITLTTITPLKMLKSNTKSLKLTMTSWIEIPPDSDFYLRNLPFGVFSTSTLSPRIGTAIGPYVLDLKALAQDGIFSFIHFDANTLEKPLLNEYAGLGKDVHLAVRQLLLELLKQDMSL